MRAVIQRTRYARVFIGDKLQAEIGIGMLILLGIARTDTEDDANYLAGRIPGLRIFDDPSGKLNLSVSQIGGGLLVVPNFTLYAECTRGRRPRFELAMAPEPAKGLFAYFTNRLESCGANVETGLFGAGMRVELENDGPVTLVVDTHHLERS